MPKSEFKFYGDIIAKVFQPGDEDGYDTYYVDQHGYNPSGLLKRYYPYVIREGILEDKKISGSYYRHMLIIDEDGRKSLMEIEEFKKKYEDI